MKRGATLLIMLLAACGATESVSRSGQLYVNASQGYSVDQPDGWRTSEDRGSIRFAPATGGRHTITVRSAPRPKQVVEGKATTNEDLTEATLRALRGLPRAKVDGQTVVEGGELPGVRYSLTFLPAGGKGVYRRTHVVLFGQTHVFHVIYTAPESEAVDERSLQDMVLTLKEEV